MGNSVIGSYSVSTPNKGRSLIRNESPQSINGSPRLTPQSSPPPLQQQQNVAAGGIHQENVGGTTYFYPTGNHSSSQNSSTGSEPTYGGHHNSQLNLSYTHPGHVYSGPASHILNMQPRTQLSSSFFMPEEMRNDLMGRNEIANVIASNENQDLPHEVDSYHSLCPLEPSSKIPTTSSTYKATHSATGIKYCLRRLHGFRLQSTKCMSVVEMWKKLQHSNIVQKKEVFTTKAFGDQCKIFFLKPKKKN